MSLFIRRNASIDPGLMLFAVSESGRALGLFGAQIRSRAGVRADRAAARRPPPSKSRHSGCRSESSVRAPWIVGSPHQPRRSPPQRNEARCRSVPGRPRRTEGSSVSPPTRPRSQREPSRAASVAARTSSMRSCSVGAPITRSDMPVPRLSERMRRRRPAELLAPASGDRHLPRQLHVREEAGHEDDVEVAAADDLVGDRDVPALHRRRVSGDSTVASLGLDRRLGKCVPERASARLALLGQAVRACRGDDVPRSEPRRLTGRGAPCAPGERASPGGTPG